MTYFLLLLVFIILIIFLSNFIKLPDSKYDSKISFFIKSVIIITLLISLFAVFATKFQTQYIVILGIISILIFKKSISFTKFSKSLFISDLKNIILIFPIYLIQLALHFNFKTLTPFAYSDDIYIYASFSKHIFEFGQENKFALYSYLYPKLFTGLNPYHYYELWANSMFQFLTKLSYSHTLIFITYPLLLWILAVGINSIIYKYIKGVTPVKSFFLMLCLFFSGPVYLSIYEYLFNDGNLFNSSVFTIVGFVKQTLPFSYYGQKHLPIYILGLLLFILLLNRKNEYSVYTSHALSVASFGILPGTYSGVIFLFFNKKTRRNCLLLFLFFISFFVINSIFDVSISKEISKQTFYFNTFLTELNWKGEIIRILQKLIIPMFWFTILYIPYLFIVLLYRKENKFIFRYLKALFYFSFLSYIGGSMFTLILQGLNTDQFLTNLLPLYNLVFILLIIFIIRKLSLTKYHSLFYSIIIISTFINITFTFDYHFQHRYELNKRYDTTKQKLLIHELNNTKPKIIAYLLSNKIIYSQHPMHQCNFYPAKFLFNENYLNFINMNYPFINYPKNSSSIVFSPYNQMKYYVDKSINFKEFEKKQFEFLKKNKIVWLLCGQDVIVSKYIKKAVIKEINDPISGEKYLKLNF